MDTRIRFAKEAEKWALMKVPYRHRGMTMKGCDCTGLIVGTLRNLNKCKSFKLRKYKFDWNMHAGAIPIISKELSKVGDFVTGTKELGDILIFKFGKCEAHLGIYIGNNRFVHSVVTSKCCKIGFLNNSMWAKRLSRIIRLNEEKLLQYK